ncbi:MAG: hypothetical protein OXC19_07885 [Bryobacterales bacterium]|nr:hypothetical protein [Bryobacterales bacterium]
MIPNKGLSRGRLRDGPQSGELVYRLLRWGHNSAGIGEQTYTLQFRQQCIAGMKRPAKSLGYELVPKTPAAMEQHTPGPPCT